ncbi:MAG: hydrolase, partial [bacterium]|nr:hydrolase [bacterium]
MENKNYTIKAKSVVTPYKVISDSTIHIKNETIQSMGNVKKEPLSFDLGNRIVFPGLINAHDHLLGNYFPRIGRGPYINWLPWDNDLKSSPVYTERSKIPPKEVYLLAAYRNLISGVTTVSDHIPHFVNDPFIDILPIRALKDYTLAHESSDYDLKWGDGIEVEYKRAKKKNLPFITHIEEGYDEESETGIDKLSSLKALSEHTVLIHAIGLSDQDIRIISKKKANIVWC